MVFNHERKVVSVQNLSLPPKSSNVPVPVRTFKPPYRQASTGDIEIDSSNYRYMCQDVTSIKTMLFRLKRSLEQTDTMNPFDPGARLSIVSLGEKEEDLVAESLSDKLTLTSLVEENQQLRKQVSDLRRQVVYHEQVSADKERTIRLLQSQMSLYYNPPPS